MNYSRQLQEADRLLQQVSSTHQNILSLGGDVLDKYELICEERIQRAVREATERVEREQGELRGRAVGEAVEAGRRELEEALREAREQRGRDLGTREGAVRRAMETIAAGMVAEERGRGEQRTRAALASAEERWREQLTARIEEVRLEERVVAGESLSRLRAELEGEMRSKVSQVQQEDGDVLNSSLRELEEEHRAKLELVRREDKEQGETEMNEIIQGFNSKISQKETELELTLANVRKLEEQLRERDERIEALEAKYRDSRIEFSHFVDTIGGLGGGYTVNNDIL